MSICVNVKSKHWDCSFHIVHAVFVCKLVKYVSSSFSLTIMWCHMAAMALRMLMTYCQETQRQSYSLTILQLGEWSVNLKHIGTLYLKFCV